MCICDVYCSQIIIARKHGEYARDALPLEEPGMSAPGAAQNEIRTKFASKISITAPTKAKRAKESHHVITGDNH